MSNIYEALEQVCRENSGTGICMQVVLQTELARGLSLSEEMAWLHRQFEMMPAEVCRRVIQFIGCGGGEGVSTVVREYAMSAERGGKTVLVLGSPHQDPTAMIDLKVTCEYGWSDFLGKGAAPDKTFSRFGDSKLYFAPFSAQASLVSQITNSSGNTEVWNNLKQKFDLVLIDSSSDKGSSDSMALSRDVDGVVLVVEAEKTRCRVAQSVKKKIEANGGMILGVVLNKRRYYIPEFLYSRIR